MGDFPFDYYSMTPIENPIKFSSTNSFSPLDDGDFDLWLQIQDQPYLKVNFFLPESTKMSVYYPRSVEKDLIFSERIELAKSIKVEGEVEIEVTQNGDFDPTQAKAHPLPILWVFQQEDWVIAKPTIFPYFTQSITRSEAGDVERRWKMNDYWHLPLYHFLHPASFLYIRPLFWYSFSQDQFTEISRITAPYHFIKHNNVYRFQGIFYPVYHLEPFSTHIMPYNHTAEHIEFFWHGPKGTGFKKRKYSLKPFERSTVVLHRKWNALQLLVIVGHSRIEWIPAYFEKG